MQNSSLLFNIWFKNLKNCDSKYFCRSHFSFHKINIQIDVFVIQLAGHIYCDNAFKFFKINNESGFRVNLTLYRYEQFVVMPVLVWIGTLSEYFMIMFKAPVITVKFMSCIKPLSTGNINHFQ